MDSNDLEIFFRYLYVHDFKYVFKSLLASVQEIVNISMGMKSQ